MADDNHVHEEPCHGWNNLERNNGWEVSLNVNPQVRTDLICTECGSCYTNHQYTWDEDKGVMEEFMFEVIDSELYPDKELTKPTDFERLDDVMVRKDGRTLERVVLTATRENGSEISIRFEPTSFRYCDHEGTCVL